jgi:hypothetical protein
MTLPLIQTNKGSGSGGAVTSVFGRTGAVVAQALDYDDVPDLTLSDGVNAINFGTGTEVLSMTGPNGFQMVSSNVGSMTIQLAGIEVLPQIILSSNSGTRLTFDVDTPDGFYMQDDSGDNFMQGGDLEGFVISSTEQINLAGAPTLFVQSTVSELPSGSEGWQAYATDGLKVGEISGSGTGVPVYYSNGSWRVYSTDQPVSS